jgi:L-lysine exporter family protein LysE/ArgO
MAHSYLSSITEGFFTGAALIIAIGAQNAFVLKQGILRNHVFIITLICMLIDALLIVIGVSGFGIILSENHLLLICAKWGGAAFLIFYGFLSFKSVLKNETLNIDSNPKKLSLKAAVLTVLALSLLNPHVYLDTVVLLGSIGAQALPEQRPYFMLGAIVASIIWFSSLGYGAKFLQPLFKKAKAWKVLDFITGSIMWVIAISLFLK